MVFGVLRINSPRHKNNHTLCWLPPPLTPSQPITGFYRDASSSWSSFSPDHLFPFPCIQKFWVKGVQNKNIFDWRIHYPQCLSNLEAIGRKHFVKALPSKYSSSSTLRIFFSANILNHLPSKYSPLSSEYSFLLRKPWCFYISRWRLSH